MAADHSSCVVKRPPTLESSDWTSFLLSLESVLVDLILHGRDFLVLTVVRPDDPFVQFCISASGVMTAEAASSVFRPGCCEEERHRLSPSQLSQLEKLGWDAPEDKAGGRLLWHRDADPRWPCVAPLYAELLTRTLVEVFRVESPKEVVLRVGNMPFVGDRLARVQ